jgi:hypothetical protein
MLLATTREADPLPQDREARCGLSLIDVSGRTAWFGRMHMFNLQRDKALQEERPMKDDGLGGRGCSMPAIFLKVFNQE